MSILIRKELTSLFCSSSGLAFSLVFLLVNGLMLWVFAGNFNILDAGYATAQKFFGLAPLLLIVLIPSLTMRLIAEEKRSGTQMLLLTRPLGASTIWFSKWISTLLFVTLVILSTLIYMYSIYALGSPIGNVDINTIIVSYISLICITGIFIALGILASSLSGNQIIAFSVGLVLNFTFYYGFHLISTILQSGYLQAQIDSFGLYFHHTNMLRGVVELADISTYIVYIITSWILTAIVLELRHRPSKKYILFSIGSILFICIVNGLFPSVRIDTTKDKRYSVSSYSKKLMEEITKDGSKTISVNVYLEGDLNSGFQRLQNATKDFLVDLNRYADHKLNISFINPSILPVSREDLPQYMVDMNMPGILLNEVDRNGKLSQQLIYPYAQVIVNSDTLEVPLLKNISGHTAEENLNASAENLEFQFVDALRLLLRDEEQNIAFIEGHGELSRAYVYDAEDILAKYFYVNRGEIGNEISVLDNFRVVIIAGSTQKFTETEKYILDQYLMSGGRILWLIDGAYVSKQDLVNTGESASMKNETGLDDLLFTYGIRIEPNLIQDSQSSQILVNTGNESPSVTIPWYYSPLLLSSPDNSITKNIGEVKAEFASSISFLNNSKALAKNILLTTANHSHIVQVPEMINLDIDRIQNDPTYFNNSYLPVSVSLEGQFHSAYKNRGIPDSLYTENYNTQEVSVATKMIVAGSSAIIRNEISGTGEGSRVVPMGYDPLSKHQYGNREFIVNAVNWLANDNEWMSLKSKSRTLNLLDKKQIFDNRNTYAVVNTLAPLVFIILIITGVSIRRRLKYGRT